MFDVWVQYTVQAVQCTVWLAVTEAVVSSWLCKPRPGRRRTVSRSVARDVIVQSYEITATSHPPTFVMKQSFHTLPRRVENIIPNYFLVTTAETVWEVLRMFMSTV